MDAVLFSENEVVNSDLALSNKQQEVTEFTNPFSEEIWRTTYKHHTDTTVNDTFRRVAKAIASVEKPELQSIWEEKFYKMLTNFRVTAGGRIISNAGTEWGGTTLMNCLSGGTKVITDAGLFLAKDLAGKTVNVLTKDGEFRPAKWESYGKQKLFRITLKNGDELFATENHDWLISSRTGLIKIQTKNIVGKRIPLNCAINLKINSKEEFRQGVQHGLTLGDGNLYTDFKTQKKYSVVNQFGDSRHLIVDWFDTLWTTYYCGDKEGIYYVKGLPPHFKTFPDITEYSFDYLRGFLSGYIAADGCVDSRGSVMIHCADKSILIKLRELCAHIALPTINIRLERENSPFTGKKSELWKLSFQKQYFQKNDFMLIKNKHIESMNLSPESNSRTTIEVLSVDECGSDEVFCCDEPVTHSFTIENGYLTGNCFVGTKPDEDQDSIEGIVATLLAQVKTLKSEGGWGMNFSFLRPRGSFIHGIGVETPGAVKYMELFDKSSDIITAGSGVKSKKLEAKGKIRKGAMMGVLDCWHPDIQEFVTAKLQPERLSKFNISVNCSAEFMDKILEVKRLKSEYEKTKDNTVLLHMAEVDKWNLIFPDTTHKEYKKDWDGNIQKWKSLGYPVKTYATIKASELWSLIMNSTYNRNDPGVLFLDIANHTHCWSYGKNSHISATNPCVAENTLVNTPYGYKTVKELKVGENISTLHPNGYEPIESIEKHDDTPVFTVKFSDGGEQIVTAAHRYHAQPKGSGSKFIEKLRLDQLKVGDYVQVEPVNFLDKTLVKEEYEQGLMLGILLGDGSCGKDVKIATSTDDSEYNTAVKNLFESNKYVFNKDDKASDGSKSLYLPFSKESSDKLHELFKFPENFNSANKYILDLFPNQTYSIFLGIINGLLATDGNVNLSSNHPALRFYTSSKSMAQDIRRILLLLGIHGRVTESFFQDGGTINGRVIERKNIKYMISVSGFDCKALASLCYNNINPAKRNLIKKVLYNSKLSGNSRTAAITSIESCGTSTVYDLYCKESDSWITDGYVQQGCGEQCLPFGAVCNLASINLTQFVDLKNNTFNIDKIKEYSKIAVRFLDNVNEYTDAPLPEYVESIRNRRRIGIGVMGWASSLYLLGVRFGSKKAFTIQSQLMKALTHSAVEASIELAIEKGMFKDCDPKKHSEANFWNQIELPEHLKIKIKKHGIRNSALFSIQPTGNTSILANIVSGGLEPVFLDKFIRTSIVPHVPANIADKCPKYWEGEFKETELFYFSKEGDDVVLRGQDENGIVYKIDKNRGLTKETLCEDYSVAILTKNGTWDSNANWAVTTEKLSVAEHINDLNGFAKWIDSSMSKTVNIPNDYPFEEFESVYLDAYKSKLLKGITTYRAGTMTNVLSAVGQENREKLDTITKTTAPKRPIELNAELHHFTLSKIRYYCAVGLIGQDEPYEIFTGINLNDEGDVYIPKTVKTGKIIKRKRGEYAFVTDDEKYVLTNGHANDTADALTRMISCALRHGSPLEFVIDQLSKTKGPMTTFSKVLSRTVKKYMENGHVSAEKCPQCSNSLVFSEGCKMCNSCGYSACN